MNKYKEAIKLVLEFFDPDKELCPEPDNRAEALVRHAIIQELGEWRDWITEDDDDLV